MPWSWNGESGQLPTPADYNQDHIYFYFFEGDGTSEIFSFEDGGGYGDNGGALNIEIYEMVNQFESNYSLSFDGIDDWVDTGIPHTDLSGASSLTFEFSFKRRSGSSDGQYQGLITSQTSGESQLGIRITDLNYLELGFKNDNSNYNDAIYDAETIDFDVWYNFYVELSNNQVVWYRDGVQVETDNVDFQSLGQESENVPPLSIGRGNTVYGEYFDGLVNEVVITIGNQNNDFAYWDFNDAEGNILTDLSGNGNNGTIYGAEWSDDVPNIGNSSSQLAATSFVPLEELQDNSLYHWQVKATDQLGLSYTTPIQTFVVNQVNDNPEPFALLAPANESMLTELTTSFHWDVPEDVDYGSSISYYEFLINTENNFDDIDPIIVNTNSYTLEEPLIEDQEYYWKVLAVDDRGGETASEFWTIWTNSENTPPSEFTLVAPEQNSEETTLIPTFSWTESYDPDLYDEYLIL